MNGKYKLYDIDMLYKSVESFEMVILLNSSETHRILKVLEAFQDHSQEKQQQPRWFNPTGRSDRFLFDPHRISSESYIFR